MNVPESMLRHVPAPGATDEDPAQLILQAMTEGVSLSTEDGIIVYANPAEEAMFGYGPGELIGCHVSVQNAYPPEENQRLIEAVIATLKERGSWQGAWHNRRRDGSTFTTSSRISAVQVGGRTHWLCVQRDVTAEKAIEAELRNSATRLDLAVTAHGIGIFDWDVQTGQLLWSAQEEQLFGLPAGSFGGDIANWAERVHPEDVEAMNRSLAEAMAAGRTNLTFCFRIRRPDGEVRWIEGAGRFLYGEDGTPLRMVGTNVDTTERRRAEERQLLLVNELNHRVKNTLATVQGLAWQSFRHADVPDEPRMAFEARLAALSAAHDVLTRSHWEAAPLRRIAEQAARVHDAAGERMRISGPDVTVRPQTALALALALHELGTNAGKYGALSVPDGRIALDWTVTADRLQLSWRESAGPPVVPPERRGFGSRLIERSLAAELGGTVEIDFRPEGVICSVDAPLG